MKIILWISAFMCLGLTVVAEASEKVRHYGCDTIHFTDEKAEHARIVSITTDDQLSTPLRLKSPIVFTEISRASSKTEWVKDSSYELLITHTDLVGSYPIHGNEGLTTPGGWVRAVRPGSVDQYVAVVIPVKMITGNFHGIHIQESRPLPNGTGYVVQDWHCFNLDGGPVVRED